MGTITIPRHCWNSNGVFSLRRIILGQFFYSTTASISRSEELNSLTNWLVSSLGFSEKQALATSTKLTEQRQSQGVKKVCNPNLLRNADSVINFLQEKGLEKPQIRNVVYSVPRLLTCKILLNLEPKMKFFQELGFSVHDFARVISSQHVILGVGLDSTIRPAIEHLRAIMGSHENVVRVIKGFRLNHLQLVTKHLVVNVSTLRAQGIPIEFIRKRVLHLPATFTRKPEDFKEIIARAETKWGVSPSSKAFLYAVEVPRYAVFQVLKEKGLISGDRQPYSVVKINESRFLARFIQPFEGQIPDLLDIYTKSISSSIHRETMRGKNI